MKRLQDFFPTFFSVLRVQRKFVSLFLGIFCLVIILALLVVLFPKKEKIPVSSKLAALATAYGSQRHIFSGSFAAKTGGGLPSSLVSKKGKVAGIKDVFAGSLVAIWLKEKQITASFSHDKGVSWQELPSPIVSERVESVAGMQDANGEIHFVYEQEGKIFYRKISSVFSDGQIKPENWSVSQAVNLDGSGLAHRPSLILDNKGQPLVAWSSQSKAGPRMTKINFMRAKGDPLLLKNWCSARGDVCGQTAHSFFSGSADSLGIVIFHSIFHPVLVQMPQTDDLYLFWSDPSKKGKEILRLVTGRKTEGGWDWGEIKNQDELDPETFQNFSLAATADGKNNRVVIVYVGKGGNSRVMAYETTGEAIDLSPNQRFGIQFSIAAIEGKYYLFYQKENGKIAGRQYDFSWSEELLESSQSGSHPSVANEAVEGKLFVVFGMSEKEVGFLSYSFAVPSPTPTASPTPSLDLSPSPSPIQPSPTATTIPTLAPTVTPTPTESPSPTPEE